MVVLILSPQAQTSFQPAFYSHPTPTGPVAQTDPCARGVSRPTDTDPRSRQPTTRTQTLPPARPTDPTDLWDGEPVGRGSFF